MAGATATTMAGNPEVLINHKISNILQYRQQITKELQDKLNSAADSYKLKSYKLAAKYFKSALDSIIKDKKTTDHQTVILTKYMLCACWLESTDAKDLSDALKILEELERDHGCSYPMLYYAIGRAYFKLYRILEGCGYGVLEWYKISILTAPRAAFEKLRKNSARFNKADETLRRGFAAFRNDEIKFDSYCIPGNNDVIPESSRIGLVASLSNLKNQCSSWRRPDAVCCFIDCSTIGHSEGADKNIFFGSPTFTGMVQVTCSNPSNFCLMSFHSACWKAKKEFLCSTGKVSDKEVLHSECFTPNCVDGKGERCMIRKIEIFDDKAKVKATIEPRGDDSTWHAKTASTPKGAIKKQHHQPKTKVITSEPRAQSKVVPSEPRAPVIRNPRPPAVPKELPKSEEIEEEEDIHDEEALKEGVEKLRQLRLKNFDISDDNIWRPNLSMYGSEYMLATAEVLPDPDFSNDTPENEEIKAFIFSYFYALISMNGPMKLSNLEEKWKEAQEIVIEKNCESILKHHADIAEFLIQSLKFSIVTDYICTADKLPDAYDLAKADACEILKFFMENDIDQNSTTSSLDDEAVFNDILNQEKNNNSLPYSTKSEVVKVTTNEESNVSVPDVSLKTFKKDKNEPTNITEEAKIIVPEEGEKLPEVGAITDICPPEIPEIDSIPIPICDVVEENKPVVSKPLFTICEAVSPIKKIVQKRSHSPEFSGNIALDGSPENNASKIQKEFLADKIYQLEANDSPNHTINGIHSVGDIEKRSRFVQSMLEPEKLARSTKSTTNNIENHNAHFGIIRETSIINSGEPEKRLKTKNKTAIPLASENKEKMIKLNGSDVKIRQKSKNETTSLVPELSAKVEKLNDELARSKDELARSKDELARSKDETEQLNIELAQVKKANASSRGQMLQKILHLQHAHHQSVINSKLEAMRYDYNLILGIQRMLANAIGQNLPYNGSDLLKNIGEIENIAKNHQAKFTSLNEQLCASMETETTQDIDLQEDEIPKFQKCDLFDVINLAFGMYRMHQMKEFQKLQQPQFPPSLFRTPQFGQAPDYYRSKMNDNNAANFYPGLQPGFFHSMTAQQTIPHMYQQPVQPHLMNHQLSRPVYHYGQQQSTNNAHQPNNAHGHSIYLNPVGLHNNASPLPHRPDNPPPDAQPNFVYRVAKLEHKDDGATKEIVSTSERSNVQSSEQPNIVSAKQNQPTKFCNSQPSNDVDEASTRSTVRGSNEANDIIDRNHASSSVNYHSEMDALIAEDVLNYDIRAYPAMAGKIKETTSSQACENLSVVLQRETKSQKKAGHSMDKLMRRLRSNYTGVLELDLLKSVECVRKKHNNSLSKLPMLRIVREADKFIEACQQKQLCGYGKRPTNQTFTVLNTNSCFPPEGDRKHHNSVSSSSSVASSKRETPGSSGSRKQWEPVSIPNDTWIKQTEESECIICFDVMLNAESYTLQCKHSFHKACIKNWYKHQAVGEWVMGSCPMCRLHSTIDDEYPPLPLG